ncbi:hypothetical protein Glove_238g13 [Diversispora epigaea]|uniref:RNA-dependent RNA polymerase n=1 Tax=Diversispora epigaea TaxID=1348612 RepID=A0A397IAI0_9GLOM|nr:hypothetical protein Glove_238g13 [Diversispora epigaea]
MATSNYSFSSFDKKKYNIIENIEKRKCHIVAFVNAKFNVKAKEIFATSVIKTYLEKIAYIDINALDEVINEFATACLDLDIDNFPNNNPNALINFLQNQLENVLFNKWMILSETEDWMDNQDIDDDNMDTMMSVIPTEQPMNPWIPFASPYSLTDLPEEYEYHIKNLPFLIQYEIVRLLKPFGPIEPSDYVWKELNNHSKTQMFDSLRIICENHLKIQYNLRIDYERNLPSELRKLLPYTSSLHKINDQSNQSFAGPKKGSRLHVKLSANVTMQDMNLKLDLNPPTTTFSRRLYRIYSSERFLSIKVKTDFETLDDQCRERLKSLLLSPLLLAGRTYEFLYAKEDTLYYFATTGINLEKINILNVINHNLPLEGYERNLNMTTSKFRNRISLAFSNTTNTITFEPNQIIYDVPDIEDNLGHCFTDGCAGISLAAMKKIAEIMGYEETPHVIQGRIGGAKGVWYLDPSSKYDANDIWIKLRKSQIKYHVNYRLNHLNGIDDQHLRNLEILHVVSSARNAGALNAQFIRVLENGGVPHNVFIELIKENVEKIKNQIVNNDDPRSLRAWVYDSGNLSNRRLDQKYYNMNTEFFGDGESSVSCGFSSLISGWPESVFEQCVEMLDAGFTPSNCLFLAKCLKQILKIQLKSLFNKYRIELPLSRVLICIADPTQKLRPGEIFLQLDKDAGIDERTGMRFGVIEGDVILARNPCVLPSDIVRAKAVRNNFLDKYYNVLIFPVTSELGEGSLVDKLSGGDYDGDKVFVCWDPRIVLEYKNTPVDLIQPSVKNAFTKSTETITEYIEKYLPCVQNPIVNSKTYKLQKLILDGFFLDQGIPLGMYDRYHKLNSSHNGISHQDSIYLAQMFAKLLDVSKQGETLKAEVFERDSYKFGKLKVPHWMKNDNTQPNRNPTGIMDKLCNTIKVEIDNVNRPEFSISDVTPSQIDPHIGDYWQREMHRAENMNDGGAFYNDLCLIVQSQRNILTGYNSSYSKVLNSEKNQPNSSNADDKKNSIKNKILDIDLKYINIFYNDPPVDQYRSDILNHVDRADPESEIATYELNLKATALYNFMCSYKPEGTCAWKLAFRTLCKIKARMVEREKNATIGGPRCIVDEMWNSLKVDRRWLDRG